MRHYYAVQYSVCRDNAPYWYIGCRARIRKFSSLRARKAFILASPAYRDAIPATTVLYDLAERKNIRAWYADTIS